MSEIASTLCNLISALSSEMAAWLPSRDATKEFGNSPFTTSLLGSLFGAIAGAWAAQRIVGRGKVREELTNEIRNTNVGIMLALSIANVSMALKKQHVKTLKETYDNQCRELEERKANGAAGQFQGPFSPLLDFRALDDISPPIVLLRELVFGRLSTTGRALPAVTAIEDGILNLNAVLARRNRQIERFKNGDLPEGAEIVHMYFGIPYADGHTNQEYGDTIKAIANYTDDIIFYSILLCGDLRSHGMLIAEKYKRNVGGIVPKISDFDIKDAQASGLIPQDNDYESWLSGFQFAEKKSRHWWQSF